MSREYRLTLPRRIVNSIVTATVKVGLAPRRTQLLSVKGRRSGAWYTTPVNLVLRDGKSYLVAPYGERSWVRNIRAAGVARLRHGAAEADYAIEPAGGDEAAAVLHQYWRENAITRPFFGAPGDADDAAFLAEVPAHPVFRLRPSGSE